MERREVGFEVMLRFVTRPIQLVLGLTERDLVESVQAAGDIEADTLGAVQAIESATNSIERHVEVIETLATSIDPLRASVDRLTDTMQELVAMMAPMGAVEHEMHHVGRLFGRHRHDDQPGHEAQPKS